MGTIMNHMQAKKSLGQNFLLDTSVGERIVTALNPQASDTIVEIGPGTGFLTSLLASSNAHIIAIEKDHNLIPHLLKKFPLSSNVSIIEGDILKADIRVSPYDKQAIGGVSFFGQLEIGQARSLQSGVVRFPLANGSQEPVSVPRKETSPITQLNSSYKVVGNIPYYITAPIIRKLLELTPAPEVIVLMVQKEVAERITAQPGDMSILAIATQYYATPEYLFTVPRTAFDPIPQVDSAVIRLTPHTPFDTARDKKFFRLVKIGFASRRKTLANNLAAGLHTSKEVITEKIIALGLNPSTRAQELTLHDWEMIHQSFDSFHE